MGITIDLVGGDQIESMKPQKAFRLWKRGTYITDRLTGMKTWKTAGETARVL